MLSNSFSYLIELADRSILPDFLIRSGIHLLNRKRLSSEKREDIVSQQQAKELFIEEIRRSPIAVETQRANEQHYELPPAFFQKVLGRRMKYSSCYWPPGMTSLDDAETAMLRLTCDRAQLSDGMEILELGCGWGAVSLWMAENYPNSRILSMSNSKPQGAFIRNRCAERNLDNLEVVTADINDFDTDRRFDRIISVEMFEHMRNWGQLLERISRWLKPGGKLFVHIFTHLNYPYLYRTRGAEDWMGRHFFTGGMMPSDDLFLYLQEHVVLEKHWRVDGTHYRKTAEAWLQNLDAHQESLLPVLAEVYGPGEERRWFQRWRIFFMACAGLWGFRKGQEWLVSHYRFRNRE